MSPLRRQRPLLLLLAFAASLLLSLLPTVGRLHQALNSDPLLPGWNAMCTMRGLMVAPAPLLEWFSGGDAAARGRGQPDHQASDECPYCPLLAAAALLVGTSPVWMSPRVDGATFLQRRHLHGLDRHFLGLGPRGPPLARIAI